MNSDAIGEYYCLSELLLCCGLIELDTLIRDNNNQLLRCHNGTETNIQTIF